MTCTTCHLDSIRQGACSDPMCPAYGIDQNTEANA